MSVKPARGLAETAKDREMTSELFIDEVRGYLDEAARDYPGVPKKTIHWRLARVFGMTPRRVRAYSNGEVRHVSAEEYAKARAAHRRRRMVRVHTLLRELETLHEQDLNDAREENALRERFPVLGRLLPGVDQGLAALVEELAREAESEGFSSEEEEEDGLGT